MNGKSYTEVIRRVPAEWLKLPIEKFRDITGISGLISFEPRGFGGFCEIKEDAINFIKCIYTVK